jgi:hypothetical protein
LKIVGEYSKRNDKRDPDLLLNIDKRSDRQFWKNTNALSVYVSPTGKETRIPKTIKESESFPDNEAKVWRDAREVEWRSFINNDAWEFVDRKNVPDGSKILRTIGLHSPKVNSLGEFERAKYRVVACGSQQEEGVDFWDVYASTMHSETFRLLISIYASDNNLSMKHYDVSTAFLQAKMPDDSPPVFMNLPLGFPEDLIPEEWRKKDVVVKLLRPVYGLHQAPNAWERTVNDWMFHQGFRTSDIDKSIFIKEENDEKLIVGKFVDDFYPLGKKNSKLMKNFEKEFFEKFKAKDHGEISYTLGIRITTDVVNGGRVVKLDQSNYISKVVEYAGLSDCKPIEVPVFYPKDGNDIDVDSPLLSEEKKKEYQKINGCLLEIAMKTRPEILYFVVRLCSANSCPKEVSWENMLSVLKYLKGTIALGLVFCQPIEGLPVSNDLIAYSDADWASDSCGRKSRSGSVFIKNGSAIAFHSKKQTVVALSSCEAEYISLCETVKTAKWLANLMNDLGISCKSIKVFEDNQSAMKLAESNSSSGRTKHIDVRFHYVRENVSSGFIALEHCGTSNMTADIFTKALDRVLFTKHRKGLGVI